MNAGVNPPVVPAHGEVFYDTGTNTILMYHGRHGWYDPTAAIWLRLVLK
jgi:hypothetical protein